MVRFAYPLLLLFLLCSQVAQAAPKHLFKIASLAPAGSVWVQQFEKFGSEVTEKTGGEVAFRIYPGGVMGDDQAMYRKMRVGQLHGGGFTMTGISAVVPDFRIMAIPFLFRSYDEVDHVWQSLMPTLQKRFHDQGLELVAMTEVGFIYAMSTKPINNLEELQASTNWSPAGDPISEIYLQNLGITPVQLTIPDVLSSLQSGLIETVYNSLYGSIVLQWFTKARHIVDHPYGYAYGAFALDGKKFNRLSDSQKDIIRKSADTHFAVLLEDTRRSNEESRKVMEERGSEFVTIDEATLKSLHESRDKTIDQLIPESLSREIFTQAKDRLDQFRAQSTKEGVH